MSTELIHPVTLAPAKGFAHATCGHGTPVMLAGQIGCGPDGKVQAPGDLVQQFGRTLDNLLEALQAAGGKPTDMAQMRIFVTDVPAYRAHLKELGAVWRERFGRHYPAMTLAGVTELFDPEALLEIDGLAFVELSPDG